MNNLTNAWTIAKPDKPLIKKAVRLKDGIHISFDESDYGGLEILKVHFNWTDSTNGSLNDSMVQIILFFVIYSF